MRFVAPVAAALLVGGMAVVPVDAEPASAAPAAPAPEPATTTTVDDSDLDSWVYSAGWTHAAGEGWTAQNHGGSESFSNTAGARATLTFTGTSIELGGTLGPNAGRARAWVDCGEPVTLDLYAPQKKYGLTVATFAGLPAGTHTLVVEVLGTRNSASTDTYAIIDHARVTDDPALADPSRRWQGGAYGYSDAPIQLVRAGCGPADLVSQLKVRSSGGWFAAGDAWGAVNGHSAELANGRAAPGPVVLAGSVREAATLGLRQNTPATLDLDLPDAPRSLLLWVAADETVGGSAQFGVTDRETGDFLPTRVLEGVPGTWSHAGSTSQAISAAPGEQKVLVVDLTGAGGAASVDEVQVWASSATAKPAELVILKGRVSTLSAARLALEVGSGAASIDADHIAAKADAFSRGPVVLGRVLADAAQPAWTEDGKPVDLSYGRTLTVSGEQLSDEALSITLPAVAWPASTSTVHVKLETGQRCRSLTASVGLADGTPSRASATLSVGVLGDGEPLPMKHNGLWAAVDYPGASRSPVTDGQIREELADELLDAKGAVVGTASSALSALVATQAAALAGTANNRSMAVTSYPIANPLVIGAGFTGNRAGGKFAPADLESIDVHGQQRQEVNATALDSLDLYPLSVDLMTDRMRQHMRTIATSTLTDLAHVASPLVRTVELVISGTPGAVVAIDQAGLDCVSAETAPGRVMPLWSQIGLPPAFLPTPTGANGEQHWQLGTNPLWWDFACPAGPAIGGLQYTATRTRLTSWSNATTGVSPGAIDVIRVDETSTATLPACGLPADQKQSAFSEWALTAGSRGAPDDASYTVAFRHLSDPTADRVRVVTGDWTDQLGVWAADAGYETLDDPLTFAIWAALAPFDLPGAIILNPFTQHALPVSAQLAVGGVLHGGSELVAKLPAASQAGSKLTFVTAESAAADAAAGRVAVLERDGTDIVIPLADGKADLALEKKAVVAGTDRVAAGIPSTKWGPGWVDESFGEGRVCTRDLGNCRPYRALEGYPGPGWDGNLDEDNFWREDAPRFPDDELPEIGAQPEPEPAAPQTEAHVGQATNLPPAAGFEAMFPQNPSRSLVGETAEFQNSFDDLVQRAWQTTQRFGDDMGGVNAAEVAMQLPRSQRVNTVALRTSSEPLYFYSALPPSVVLGANGEVGTGLRANPLALANYQAGFNDEVNLMHALSTDRARSLFVVGSPDERLIARSLEGLDAVRGYYIYETSFAGGFNLLKSVRQAGLGGEYQPFATNLGIATRYEVAVPGGIPAADITGWKKIDVFPNQRFEVTASSSEITTADREGWSFAGSTTHDWAVFDYYTPSVVGEVLTVERPSVQLTSRARQHYGVLIFTKQSGWTFFADKQDVLTADYLRGLGFRKGTWTGVQDVEMWVPTDGENYTVKVDRNFEPADE